MLIFLSRTVLSRRVPSQRQSRNDPLAGKCQYNHVGVSPRLRVVIKHVDTEDGHWHFLIDGIKTVLAHKQKEKMIPDEVRD